MVKEELIQTADSLYDRIAKLIEQSRHYVKTTVNTAMVYTYYNVGRYIVEDEQHGKERAAYGERVLKELSTKLTANFGAGWSVANLKIIKQFYLAYAKRLNTVEPIHSEKDKHCLSNSQFLLSWSHYLILMRIKNPNKLTHQDLGQMQMYVNYYDRYVKQDFEKPTIGILLCKDKNDTLVNLTLPKDANIYASAYELYLPDKALLQAKVKEWIEEFEEQKGE